MKYYININQLVLSKTSLSLTEAAILDFLIFFASSKSPKIDKKRKEGWTWIDYSELIKQMPMLGIKSRGAITPKIKHLEEEEFIKTKRFGRRLFFKLNDRVDELFINMNNTVHKYEQYRSRKRTHKDNKDKDNKDNKEIEKKFEKFWEAYPRKEAKAKAKRIWKRKNIYEHLEDILEFIENAKNTKRWYEGYIPLPTTFMNQERWNDDLDSYGEIEKKAYFRGDPVIEKGGKKYVIKNGEYLEFAGKEEDLTYK